MHTTRKFLCPPLLDIAFRFFASPTVLLWSSLTISRFSDVIASKARLDMTNKRHIQLRGAYELSSFRKENVSKCLLQALLKHFSQYHGQKKKVQMPSLTEYALRSVISHCAFDVMTFEKREIFEADHSLVKPLPKAKQTVFAILWGQTYCLYFLWLYLCFISIWIT